jgi:hypothetical protein
MERSTDARSPATSTDGKPTNLDSNQAAAASAQQPNTPSHECTLHWTANRTRKWMTKQSINQNQTKLLDIRPLDPTSFITWLGHPAAALEAATYKTPTRPKVGRTKSARALSWLTGD